MACAVITELSVCATKEGTYIVTLAYADDAGAFTPESVTWDLTDQAGNIINEREDVSIVTPSTSNRVVLSGNDLDTDDGYDRLFTATVTYNSATDGNGLVQPVQAKFNIGPWIDVIPSA